MDLPKISSGMLDGLKSRFGRGKAGNDPYGGGFDDYDDFGDVDEYPDYGEYGYDEERDGGYAPASSQYDPYDTVTTRSTGEQRSMAPRLVSLSDAKRSTAVPESLVRDPLSTRAGVGRTLVDEASSGSSSSALPRSERSESLDAVFTPTASPSAAAESPAQAPQPAAPAESFDPYAAFTGASVVSHKPTRSCVVIRPKAYGDAERVAKVLRAGDAAVLCLTQTPDQLAKRILDFSFGAATALGASADCVAEKVFVLAVGPGLDDQERRGLQSQGVL